MDCVVIEGAGSPAEINLRDGDIVNMSMAESADAPVILVGDIDLGGVFASLLGTVMLLTEEERARVKGVIINKFRGDVRILEPGLRMLEERIHVPVLGVIPWMDVQIEDEDSVTSRLRRVQGEGDLDVAVVRLPHLSNFTDFQALTLQRGARVRYVERPEELRGADLVILPGTKNTMEDLMEVRNSGLESEIIRFARRGGTVLGICGGFQMLGSVLRDPEHVESQVPEMPGMGLMEMEVSFSRVKKTRQSTGVICGEPEWMREIRGLRVDGYEIHAGENVYGPSCIPWMRVDGNVCGVCNSAGNVIGTYLHGLFDDGKFFHALSAHLRRDKGLEQREGPGMTMDEYREREFDRLADIVRCSLDMDRIYRIIRGDM